MMSLIQKLANEKLAKKAAGFMKLVCWMLILMYIWCIFMAFIDSGSITYSSEDEQAAEYEAKQKNIQLRFLTIRQHWYIDILPREQIVEDHLIPEPIRTGMSWIFTVYAVPIVIGFYFLGRIFANIQKGMAFTEQNARYLLYYGLLQFVGAFVVPRINDFIVQYVNTISQSRLLFSMGDDGIINRLMPCAVYIVAAYIIHHGFNLQDEVDHTL